MQSFDRRRVSVALLSVLALGGSPSWALDDSEEGIRHSIELASGVVTYRAFWSEIELNDSAEIPQATITYTSYVRDVVDTIDRPVIFAFNGGPGASSSPLHTGLLGPRLLGKPDASGKRNFSPNLHSLIDIADIVLIDPVGTGFSRELTAEGNKTYWNVDGDAKAAQTAIRNWLRTQRREKSPVYIVGESYGGYRLGVMAPALSDLHVKGLIFISPALDLPSSSGYGNDLPFIFDLPTMAVTAFIHGRSAARSKTAEQVFEEAQTFAQSDYAVALLKGNELSESKRLEVAKQIAALTGLTEEIIIKNDLRVSSQEFLERLLPGRIVGRIDTRISGVNSKSEDVPGRIKAANDPALALGKSNVIKSPSLRDYLQTEVGYRGNADYVSLSLEVNFAWDWRGRSAKPEDNFGRQVGSYLQKFMQKRLDAKILLIGGYFDLATPWLAQRYTLNHSGVPASRIQMYAHASGHAMYDDINRGAVAAQLRKFIERP